VEGYDLQPELRKDRADTTNGIGGGLLVYVRNGLNVLPINKNLAMGQYCSFKLDDGWGGLNFSPVYRSPNSAPETMDTLEDFIRQADKNNVIMGDFNLPGIDWSKKSATGGRDKQFLQACMESDLEQVVDFPTQVRGNVLDLVLTNVPERVVEVKDVGRLGRSDHMMIQVSIETNKKEVKTTESVPNWGRADWASIREGCREWTGTKASEWAVSEAWGVFRDTVAGLVEEHVPVRPRRAPHKPVWLTREVTRALRRKKKLWKRARCGPEELQTYKEAEKHAANAVRNAKRRFEKRLAKEKNKNSKTFYASLKGKTKGRTAVGPLKDRDMNKVSSDDGMAEILNEFFSNVVCAEGVEPVPDAKRMECRGNLADSKITVERIKEKIKNLRLNSAAGLDQIGPSLLQHLLDEVAPALKIIFSRSLEEGELPEDWRTANVTPIFKKGAKADPGNYRPVSLTSVCCKVLESVIRDDPMEHLMNNNLTRASQHSFMARKSCTTNLLEFLETLTRMVDEGSAMNVIFLDFAKAFDKVPHRKLLAQLEAHGVEGRVLRWIGSWLVDRKQRAVLNGALSGWQRVLSGVPQGSVLGPILFLVFINNLDAMAQMITEIKKFAGDTKLGQVKKSPADSEKLQRCLDKMTKWAEAWGMSFNVSKCKVRHVGQRNPRSEYTMNGIKLATTAEERDIGVTVCGNLRPS
jgi:hypothetical protein